MKAFTKTKNEWTEVKDKVKILDLPMNQLVFAETAQDAVDIINAKFSEDFPNIKIVEVCNSWRSDGGRVTCLMPFNLSPSHFETDFKLIKKYGELRVDSAHRAIDLWESQAGKHIENFGVFKNYYNTFKYDPEEAKRQLKAIKRRENYKPRPRKHFLRMNFISSAAYDIELTLTRIFTDLSEAYVNFEIKEHRWGGRTKLGECKKLLALVKIAHAVFGKNSHRKFAAFQELKKEWIKQEVKDPGHSGLTEEFFNFMEDEKRRYKPRNKEIVPKWE